MNIPISSNPLNPLSILDSVNDIHTIPCGHLYPDFLSGLQYVSGIARSVTVTLLIKIKFRIKYIQYSIFFIPSHLLIPEFRGHPSVCKQKFSNFWELPERTLELPFLCMCVCVCEYVCMYVCMYEMYVCMYKALLGFYIKFLLVVLPLEAPLGCFLKLPLRGATQ